MGGGRNGRGGHGDHLPHNGHTPGADLVREAVQWLRTAGVDPARRPRLHADIGYCSKDFADAARDSGCDFAIGLQRQPEIWQLLPRIPTTPGARRSG